MTRAEWDAQEHPDWDGTCIACGAVYAANLAAEIRNGCLACLAQAEGEPSLDDDPPHVAEWKRGRHGR